MRYCNNCSPDRCKQRTTKITSERVSIPGRITGRTVRLFSGQTIPVIEPQSPRGMYGWRVNALVGAAIEAVGAEREGADEGQMRRTLSSFLNRIYYDLRNLGQTSQDRALNFAATNAFQAAQTFSEARRCRYGTRQHQRSEKPLLSHGQRLLGRTAQILRP